jgi:hypothetical protein
MLTEPDNAERLRSAEKIAAEVQRRALTAGIGPIGVTWDNGHRIVTKAHHILEVFRSNATSTAKFSDDELQNYPEGLNRARTEAKLAAMVRELVRRLKASGITTVAKRSAGSG